MSEQWQIRRGTTQENDDFTGAQGELTMDTEKKQLRVHDGATQGGAGTVDPVVAFQTPTAQNNYTWYRKYASGWVEQGGLFTNSARLTQIVFPVVMADTNYCALSNLQYGDSGWSATVTTCIANNSRTTTGMQVLCYYNSSFNTGPICWRVEGMAA